MIKLNPTNFEDVHKEKFNNHMFSGEENASDDPKVVFTVGNEAAAADRDGKLSMFLLFCHI